MSKLAKALTAAAGNAGAGALYVEDVFSTYLYTGTGAAQTITNGIDLDGEGGLVWIKNRDTVDDNVMFSPTFGPSKMQRITNEAQESVGTDVFQSFNSDGFTHGGWGGVGGNGNDIASWTFRKAEKFFDVVTYTGDGVAGRTVAHNLGSTPAVIIVKRLTGLNDWFVYHSSLGATKALKLNKTDDEAVNTVCWNDTEPTDSVFSVGTFSGVNTNTVTYVAYLFASDAGGFGDDGSESIIKCGSYTGNGSTDGPVIDLGFEPQWVMIKRASAAGTGWYMHDIMRGMPNGGTDSWLEANSSAAEVNSVDWIHPTATGFNITNTQTGINGSGDTYIYIAIRRPMKTPESGTEVFNALTYSGNETTRDLAAGFAVDMTITPVRTGSSISRNVYDRLRGRFKLLETNSSNAEGSNGSAYGIGFDEQDGTTAYLSTNNVNAHTYVNYAFKRATGFFDVVAYSGDSASSRNIAHNLSASPELIMLATRTTTNLWPTYHKDLPDPNPTYPSFLRLNTNGGINSSGGYYAATPTESVFTIGEDLNASGQSYIAYLFATVAGVSKVGNYTGTAADLNVDCGFSAGARWIMIKRTDSTGDWYVWDSARGIVVGNDPYLLLNSAAAEVTSTDYIDPLSSGFTVTSSAPAALNASGGTYIFLAIA